MKVENEQHDKLFSISLYKMVPTKWEATAGAKRRVQKVCRGERQLGESGEFSGTQTKQTLKARTRYFTYGVVTTKSWFKLKICK